MQLPSGAMTVAVVSTLVAAFSAALLVRAALRRARELRRPHYLLAGGAALAAFGAAVGVLAMFVRREQLILDQHDRTTLANLVAVVVALSGVALTAGMLRLPPEGDSDPAGGGVLASGGGMAVRHLLDGLVIAAGVGFVGWVFVSPPTRILGEATPAACTAILLPAATAAMAFGVTVILIMRCPRPRGGVIVVGSGVTLVLLSGTGLAAGICLGWLGLISLGSALLAVGLVGLAVANRTADEIGEIDGDVTRRGTAYAFVPMLAMAGSATWHQVAGGRFDRVALIASSLEGFTLVVRQYLALLDARRYATRLAEGEAHFRELAHTDPLTGLANRRELLHTLSQQVPASSPCVLLALDLDGFKHVNDMRGHDVGDAVLMEVAQRLRMNLRPGDVAARLGGDEFAVLMRARPAEAQRAAERLLSVLSGPYEQVKGRIFLSVSVGMAACETASDVVALLRNADLALRYAKQRGKNRVEQYDVEYDQLLRRRMMVEHEMRGAVERGELRLAFQPVVAVPSVRPVGAEALLRWHHPELGSVRPDEFIPLAEESGMIAKLGAWVLHQACHQLSLWLADGHDVWVSVNVSPRELHAPEYVVQVAEALRAHRVPPQRLVLEVTEHAVAIDLDELIRRLRALRAIGVRIALDDFGAGYSSLGQLRNLPIDILKIDHSLVNEPQSPVPAPSGMPPVAPLVDVVVRLGHHFGLQVIAEGVTNQAQMAMVVEAGCQFGQGQLFGWGVPAEHLEAMLEAATSPGARPAMLEAGMPPGARPAIEATPARTPDPTPGVQHVGAVDSCREIRHA